MEPLPASSHVSFILSDLCFSGIMRHAFCQAYVKVIFLSISIKKFQFIRQLVALRTSGSHHLGYDEMPLSPRISQGFYVDGDLARLTLMDPTKNASHFV